MAFKGPFQPKLFFDSLSIHVLFLVHGPSQGRFSVLLVTERCKDQENVSESILQVAAMMLNVGPG